MSRGGLRPKPRYRPTLPPSAPALLALEGSFERVGLEAGPLAQWLYFGLKDAGLPACCIETRHAKAAISAMSHNKTDRNDARSIAQLVRSGWFKSVHVKSVESQELRTLLTSREFLVNKLRDHENEVRVSIGTEWGPGIGLQKGPLCG